MLAQQLEKKQLTNQIQQLQQQIVNKAQEQQAVVSAVNNQVISSFFKKNGKMLIHGAW